MLLCQARNGFHLYQKEEDAVICILFVFNSSTSLMKNQAFNGFSFIIYNWISLNNVLLIIDLNVAI